jgi:glutathionylspermidine synthase
MYLLRKELQSENIEFVNVGPNNLYVEEGRVWAFHKSIDIILRLFPTEFSYEINNLPDILEVFEEGNVDILNDPRVIIGQCKNLYTYLWKLVKAKDIRLTEQEERAVVSTLPYTEPFNTDKLEYIIKNKDMLVLKPVYGRYSIDVFIGALHTEKEWEESVKYVEESKKDFIIQEFCQIKASDTYYTMDGKFVLPAMGFANVGCFMLNHDFAGICIRWSDDYLTSDDYTWITPVGVKSNILNIKQFEALKDRKGLWRKIAERAMFEADFTGSYAKNIEYIGLDYLTLDRNKYKELIRASEKISKLMHKTQGLIYDNLDYFADILCIEDLKSLVRYKYTEEFLFIGRMDWALDNYGNLKLLEINSETPAGILESIWVKDIISEELNIKLENPNEKLANKIAAQFYRIIEDYSKVKAVKTIGILSSTYYEDWYTAKAVLKALEGQPYEFVQGSIYDCKVAENGKLSLYGKELDAVYRYYPLDWFDKEDMSDVKEALLKTLSINPVQTIISQSKAFFAVIFELLKQGYYSDEEAEIIKMYIPKTTFDVEDLQSYDYIVKPLLSREGGGVTLACDLKEMPDEENIYQERVQTLSLDYWTHSNIKSTRETLYPIIGTYITGTEFAGIYTRLGKFITDSACVYAPVFIEN